MGFMGQQVAIAKKFQKVGNTLCFKVMKQGSFEFKVFRGNPY